MDHVLKVHLFIFGLAGSLLLCAGFLLAVASRGYSPAGGSPCGGLSCCTAQTLEAQASVLATRGLQQLPFLGSGGQAQYLWHFSSVQSLSHVRLFVTPWTAACQASLSFTISWSLLKLKTLEPVIPSNHLILCCPLLLLPPILPSIRVFSNEMALCIR